MGETKPPERRIVFISYWTPKYKAAAERLKASLDRLQLESDIQEIPDKGWTANVRHKPIFIKEMLEKHKVAYAVVWIDADGDVVQKPTLFWKIEEDLAVRFLHWSHKNVDELLSGTVFCRTTPNMMRSMEMWIAALSVASMELKTPEQQVLHQILEKLPIKVYRLPETYCRILVDRGRAGVQPDSVIVHYQFSRDTRFDKIPAPSLSAPTVVNAAGKKKEPQVVPPSNTATNRAIATASVLSTKKIVRFVRDNSKLPSSVTTAVRRALIRAHRKTELQTEIIKAQNEKAVELTAEYRNRIDKLLEVRKKRVGVFAAGFGGVYGHEPTSEETDMARMYISKMKKSSAFDRILSGNNHTVVVMGNSPTMLLLQPQLLERYPTIGCNRALRRNDYWPDWLVIADREPYCQERDAGRLHEASGRGVKILLADSIFDPTVLLRGPFTNNYRRAQLTPDFNAYVYTIGPHKKRWRGREWTYDDVVSGAFPLPVNTTTFEAPLVSGLNICASMLQAAAIMGATRVATIGIELKWESEEKSHFYGGGKEVGAYPQEQGTVEKILASLRQIKKAIIAAGISIINLSPETKCPFSSVFGNYPLRDFLAEPFDKWESKGNKKGGEMKEIIDVIMTEAQGL